MRLCPRSVLAAFALLAVAGSFAHDVSESRDGMTGVWVRDGAAVDRPDISHITAAGRAAMDAYEHSTDNILQCLLDWGRVNTVSAFPMELIVHETQVTILYEYNHSVRRVFLDQNQFPDDYPPSLMGYSIGRWEDDILVVETRNLLPGWINMEGVAPYTADAVATERFSLDTETGRLTVVRSVVDPEYYSGPVIWTAEYRRSDFPVYPYDCTVGSYGSTLGE